LINKSHFIFEKAFWGPIFAFQLQFFFSRFRQTHFWSHRCFEMEIGLWRFAIEDSKWVFELFPDRLEAVNTGSQGQYWEPHGQYWGSHGQYSWSIRFLDTGDMNDTVLYNGRPAGQQNLLRWGPSLPSHPVDLGSAPEGLWLAGRPARIFVLFFMHDIEYHWIYYVIGYLD